MMGSGGYFIDDLVADMPSEVLSLHAYNQSEEADALADLIDIGNTATLNGNFSHSPGYGIIGDDLTGWIDTGFAYGVPIGSMWFGVLKDWADPNEESLQGNIFGVNGNIGTFRVYISYSAILNKVTISIYDSQNSNSDIIFIEDSFDTSGGELKMPSDLFFLYQITNLGNVEFYINNALVYRNINFGGNQGIIKNIYELCLNANGIPSNPLKATLQLAGRGSEVTQSQVTAIYTACRKYIATVDLGLAPAAAEAPASGGVLIRKKVTGGLA